MNTVRWKAIRRLLPWLALVMLLPALFVALASSDVAAVVQVAARYGLIGSAASVAVSVVLFLVGQFGVAPRRKLDAVAEELADELSRKYELELAALADPHLLPTRWQVRPVDPLNPDAAEHTEIHPFFRDQVPFQRLVVLGAPGSGKSVLMRQLAADLVKDQGRTVVPVVLRLADWDTDQELRDWIAVALMAAYPSLRGKAVESIDGRRSTLAAELANSQRLLPVLEGLDELPPKRRKKALDKINSLGSRRPIVLTSRTKEYDKTIERGRGLSEATVIELQPLRPQDVDAYLVAGTESPSRRWNLVSEALRQPGDGPLEKALATPLMAWLARTVYHDAQSDPGELVTSPELRQVGAVRNHLLDRLLPAVLSGRGKRRHSDVRRWLQTLAQHANNDDTDGIAWWQLTNLTPANFAARCGRAIVSGLLLVTTAVGFSMQGGWFIGVFFTLFSALFVIGMHKWMRKWSPWKDVSPSSARILPRQAGFAQRVIFVALLAGLIAAKLWFAPGLSFQLVLLPMILAYTLSQVVGAPADTDEANSPRNLLRNDRTLAMVRGVITGAISGTAIGLVFAAFFTVPASIAMGVGFGLMGWFGGASTTAWGRLRIAQIWLVSNGVLPWRLMTFLQEAQSWGVLRQTGARYQFKYDALQRRLINATSAPDTAEPNRTTIS